MGDSKFCKFYAFALYLIIHVVGATAAPITVLDARGKSVTLPGSPGRIVSLTPAVTEILFAVGAGKNVVGVTSYCDFPPSAKALPKIGDFRTSIERVLGRKPNLVVASASANRQAILDLERLGVKVFAIDTQTVKQVLESIRGIGEITNNVSGANRLEVKMKSAISAIANRVKLIRRRVRTLIVVDVNTPWVAGSSTYMDDLVTLAGGVNIARDAGKGWRAFSSERVLLKQPEVILVTDDNHERLKTLPGWSGIPAVVNNRVHGNLPIAFVRPGPRLPEALSRTVTLLHPELTPRPK